MYPDPGPPQFPDRVISAGETCDNEEDVSMVVLFCVNNAPYAVVLRQKGIDTMCRVRVCILDI